MKKAVIVLILFVISLSSKAQHSMNLGVSGGVTNYFGDLGNGEFMQGSSMNPGAALTLRNIIPARRITGRHYSPVNIEARLSWNRIQYDEAVAIGDRVGSDLRNYNRGLNFRNDLVGFSSHLSYTYYPNRRLPLHRQPMAMFFYTGVGVFYGRPKADLFQGSIDINNRYHHWDDGTLRDAPQSGGSGNIVKRDGEYETDLIDWRTEGQGAIDEAKASKGMYSPWNIGIPMGFGFRYGLNKNVTLSLEFAYYRFLTDYLDDVSDAYATYKEIEQLYPNDPIKQELVKYISDPTGLGTNGFVGPATSRRGNPAIKDSFSFISFDLAYRLNWSPSSIDRLFAAKNGFW
jgi:hypothetical protein